MGPYKFDFSSRLTCVHDHCKNTFSTLLKILVNKLLIILPPKISKNATWSWQWALPVEAIAPCLFRPNKKNYVFLETNGPKKNRVGRSGKNFFLFNIFLLQSNMILKSPLRVLLWECFHGVYFMIVISTLENEVEYPH